MRGPLLAGSSAARRLAFGLNLRRLASTLLRLRPAKMLLVLFWRLLIGCARFAESDRDRLPAVFDLLSARPAEPPVLHDRALIDARDRAERAVGQPMATVGRRQVC
jgi:hypothetical protein